MPYYVRVFCKSDVTPTLHELETALKKKNSRIRIESETKNEGKWDCAEYYYKKGRKPVIVECEKNDGPDSLAAEECEEFIEEIGDPGESPAKQKVIEHLKNTKYIISCQLLNDIDDDGYDLNGKLLNFFVVHYGGLVQADGEGFYEGYNIIVELEQRLK